MIELNREFLVKEYGENSLINLTEINLGGRKIRKIDSKTFNELTKLERLYLENNEIEEIDVRLFESLSNLKALYLHNNKLKRIDSNTFNGLTKLETLYLHNNELEEIDLSSFESLSNLKAIYLFNNKLKRIYSNSLNGLTKLEALSLNNNEIEEIDERSFESLSNLKTLFLYNNKLKEIDRKCFEPLKSIEVIEIYGNVGLNALSFIKPTADKYWYNKDKIEENGSFSEWDKFLQQFPELEKLGQQQHQIAPQQMPKQIGKEQPQQQQNTSQPNQINQPEELTKELEDGYIGLILYDRYKINRKLGEGAFGMVYLVEDTKTDIKKAKKKAMKIMDQLDSTTINELELFSEINHENIVRYFDHFHKTIRDEKKTFLITEYCQNGDLRKKIDEAKRLKRDFEDRQILDWITQSTNALYYLHSKKPDRIIHRDIKPENMLLNGVNEIKLGDLGISKLMEKTHASTHAGTPLYMSPEVFKAQYTHNIYYPNTDVWSLGCVLYELKFLTKAFPQGQFGDPPIPSKVSSSGIFSSILPKMLEKDIKVRIKSRRLFIELLNFYDD